MIPGHFRAYTFWLMILMCIAAYTKTQRLLPSLGLAMITIFGFIGDQALHLRQKDHSAAPPTAIERWLQSYFWLAITISLIGAVGGVIVAFS